MTQLPVPGVAQITIKGMYGGVIPIANVFHVRRVGSFSTTFYSTAELTNACDRIRGAYSAFLPNLATGAVFTECLGRDLTSNVAASGSITFSIAGTDTGSPTGPYEGPVIRWNTTLGGRRNGRTYLPGITESAVDSLGSISSSRIGAMTTMAGTFLSFLSAATDGTHLGDPLKLVVVSSTLVDSASNTRQTFEVISGACRPIVGIQRNRRIGQ